MMYNKKPNHMGVLIGEVLGYNLNKGHVKIKLCKDINLGDSISINDASCKISELMIGNSNIKSANNKQIVTIGRIKGNIKLGDKIYRTVLDNLNKEIKQKSSKENIKRPIIAKVYLKENSNIRLELQDVETNINIIQTDEIIVKKADNIGISAERIKEQLSKTGNTPFKIINIEIKMDNNITVPISGLNNIRRMAIRQLMDKIIESFKRNKKINIYMKKEENISIRNNKIIPKVSLLLNNINENIDYTSLKDIDNIYLPFKLFLLNKKNLKEVFAKFNTYLLLPSITKGNYNKLISENLEEILDNKLKGIVISNLSHLELIKRYNSKFENLEIVANYTLNITNDNTIKELKDLGVTKYTISPELEKQSIQHVNGGILKELIVYGRTLLMTTEYCALGTLKNCPSLCEKGKYILKDRMEFEFPIYTDKINCNNFIYNSKITSISWKDLNVDSIRIDILEETLQEIQNIINIHKRGDRLEGQNYTNGNLNREI